MTLAEALKVVKVKLETVSDSSQAEAYLLLEHLTSLSRTDLTLNRQQVLSNEQVATLHTWLERRLNREPLQHILGVAPFYVLELRITPDVLIPRPETERLVEFVLEDIKPLTSPHILDVGTGSGAIALALKQERPDAVVVATDVSEAALKIARGNAEIMGLEVTLINSNLFAHNEVERFAKQLDVLVANLPYLPDSDREVVSPEVRRDPELALYAGPDGLELFRRLETQAFKLLKPDTLCWLELDPRNVNEAAKIANRWTGSSVVSDLANRERFLKLRR